MNIVGTLQDEIVSGVLPPGAHLPESTLAARFSADPDAVRAALRQLVAEDLVRIHVGRGAFVSEVSVPDLVEVLQLREALEPASARLAADAARAGKPPTVLEEIDRRLDAAADSSPPDRSEVGGGPASLAELLRTTDHAIATFAGNDRLLRALERVWHEDTRARVLILRHGTADIWIDAQRAVLRSVIVGDPETAASLAAERVRADWAAALAALSAPDRAAAEPDQSL